MLDVADRAVGALGGAGALGGVLGDVAGEPRLTDLPASSCTSDAFDADPPQVELCAPAEPQRRAVGPFGGDDGDGGR